MLGKTSNELLQKTEQAISAKVPPDQQGAFQKILTAGMKIMYSPESHDMLLKQFNQPGDPAELAGEGAAKLLGVMLSKSKGTMPMKAAIPACTILLCEGMDFLEQSGKVKITSEFIGDAMQSFAAYTAQLFKITPEKMQQLAGQAQPQPQPQPSDQGGIVSGARQGV